MNDEEITIKELLKWFNLKLNLNYKFLKVKISSDFLKSDFKKNKSKYIFKYDDVYLIINPLSKTETIKKVVQINGDIIGGYIIGYNSIEYLN